MTFSQNSTRGSSYRSYSVGLSRLKVFLSHPGIGLRNGALVRQTVILSLDHRLGTRMVCFR